MARRASDTYSTVEASAVDELAEILAGAIAPNVATPLFMDAYEWRAVCQNLPRVAHLVAGRNGFKLNADGEYYERPANLPLGHLEDGVDLSQIAGRIGAVLDALDPKGVLNVMQVAP
ncbi:MAG: hypothetical protein V4712_08370 [Pseudomonadota bacterium]